MAETHRVGLDEVARHFEELEDPRCTVNRRHPLVSVVGSDPFLSAHAAIPAVVVSACLSRWFHRPAYGYERNNRTAWHSSLCQ